MTKVCMKVPYHPNPFYRRQATGNINGVDPPPTQSTIQPSPPHTTQPQNQPSGIHPRRRRPPDQRPPVQQLRHGLQGGHLVQAQARDGDAPGVLADAEAGGAGAGSVGQKVAAFLPIDLEVGQP